MKFAEAIAGAARGRPIKRSTWWDYLTLQSCNCKTDGRWRPHSQCPEPSLMFPEYVDPKFTLEDFLAEDWVIIQ